MMYLTHPVWLILIIPFALLFFLLRLPTRVLAAVRAVILLLLILAMCRPILQISGRGGTIVVVADRSSSMPLESLEQQKELIGIIHSAMSSRNRLAVVSFGKRAVIEQPPHTATFTGFVSDPGADQSCLAEGIGQALSLIPKDTAGRIVVLSDGRWTGVNPAEAAVHAATRGIAVDYRLLERSSVHDCAIHRVDAPEAVLPGESYLITAWIVSPTRQDMRYRLLRGDTVLASGTKQVLPGISRLVFRDTAAAPGTRRYILFISGSEEDPVPENNRARIIVGIRGSRPFLCVRPKNSSGLAGLLKRSGMDIVEKNPADCSWTLEELAGYSGVLLENIPAGDIGLSGMERLAAWVSQTGTGLMMTGGKNAFGPGGYFRSPLDPVLPVSMELKQEHRKFRLAIVIAMDRSGSMGMSAGPGRTKMDLANIGAVQVLDLLSDRDEIGVIAVDSSPHVIVDIDTVAANRITRNNILSIESMGGGIFIYEALSAAAEMLINAQAGTRHILLFADAADSEEPWKYKELLEKCAEANITVSVIGLGTQHDTDASLLEDIARRGNGQIFFTADAAEIPRLFAQDTFSVTRSAFIEEQTPVKITGGYAMLADSLPKQVPDIGGYSLCYLKPDANLATVSRDEYAAPVAASWYAGRGRVLCYTGEADGEFTGPIARWNGAGDFFSSMARWSAGERRELPGNMLVVQRVRDGVCRIELHLDPARGREPFSTTPSISILRGVSGRTPESNEMQMKWEHADLLSADLPMEGSETVLASVCVPGINPVTLSPVCLPYSPEYMPFDEGKGRPALQQIADATGGKERTDMTALWKELPVRTRHMDFSVYLILMALILFLLEILQRRTGFLSSIRMRKEQRYTEEAVKGKWIRVPDLRAVISSMLPGKKTGEQAESKQESAEAAMEKPLAEKEEKLSALSAMKKARTRAKKRTRKDR